MNPLIHSNKSHHKIPLRATHLYKSKTNYNNETHSSHITTTIQLRMFLTSILPKREQARRIRFPKWIHNTDAQWTARSKLRTRIPRRKHNNNSSRNSNNNKHIHKHRQHRKNNSKPTNDNRRTMGTIHKPQRTHSNKKRRKVRINMLLEEIINLAKAIGMNETETKEIKQVYERVIHLSNRSNELPEKATLQQKTEYIIKKHTLAAEYSVRKFYSIIDTWQTNQADGTKTQ